MDKNAIKKYAVWARRELISRVSQKAQQFGIAEKNIVDAGADSVNGHLLSTDEKKQRQALIARIKQKGYEQVVEEVAYTWFNRFSALRFMEVNGYLPTHVRVFTDDANRFKPQILAEAIHLELGGLNMERVYALKNANDDDTLYKYLLITQCNALSAVLPGMFQRIADYTELLFPDNLLREGSVLEQMVTLIPEADWQDQVQIIGWLYQYYNSEPKDKVFADLKKNIKISKENIPAATQLFTPDWIVRYMVENSLGRLWIEGHPNDKLKSGWKYYLDEAEQEPDVQAQLAEIRKEYADIKPEDIRCIDPCMGSGHILVYMFDVLMQIYEAYGYRSRDAVASIVRNNLYGLDIDDRAAQIAYFSVMMKARQYDSRFFTRGIAPNVYAICESNRLDPTMIEAFIGGDAKRKAAIETIIDELHDAKEYGSILNVTTQDFSALYARVDDMQNEISMFSQPVWTELLPLIRVAEALAQKYDVVCTNPPYLSSGNMSDRTAEFVKECYPNSKSDLCTCFIEKSIAMCKRNGFSSMITMESWMSLSSFSTMREGILTSQCITAMIHMPYLGKGGTSLGINFGTSATIIRKAKFASYIAIFDRVTYLDCDENGTPEQFPVLNDYYNRTDVENFSLIPGSPITAYYASSNVFECFKKNRFVSDIAIPASGTSTGDNDSYLRLWYEVSFKKVNFQAKNRTVPNNRWFPCNKGGAYRRWAGGGEYVIDWENDGYRVKNCPKAYLRNIGSIFKSGLTWSKLGSGTFSMRYFPEGYICESIGCCLFKKSEDLLLVLGLMNGVVTAKLMGIINPSMGRQPGYIGAVPYLVSSDKKVQIHNIVESNISLSTSDWDSFETSWDFSQHPLVLLKEGAGYGTDMSKWNYTVSSAYRNWEIACSERFKQLKANEEELNRIFIDIYGLQDELKPEVADDDVTVRLADKKRDIRSLISYAVGCMFGRYSLDAEGLAYAGGEWDTSKYATFPVDRDNIIPICDDEYFDDDITGRFVKFIETVYGKETLNENLRFIAEALGGSGQPKDVIRSYFLNDFYADHLKIYQKRPIYWLFDSGKKNGFKALIYMHRYAPDTIARMRTDYVHEQQARYRTAIADLGHRIESASTAERVKLNKQLIKLQGQADEIREYEEKIHHLADQMIRIDLDDGVKHNYEMFGDVLAKIK